MKIFIKAPSRPMQGHPAHGRPAQEYSYDCGNQTLAQLLKKHIIHASKAILRGRIVPLGTILDASFHEVLIELI